LTPSVGNDRKNELLKKISDKEDWLPSTVWWGNNDWLSNSGKLKIGADVVPRAANSLQFSKGKGKIFRRN
jgi:hypothetical protein